MILAFRSKINCFNLYHSKDEISVCAVGLITKEHPFHCSLHSLLEICLMMRIMCMSVVPVNVGAHGNQKASDPL